MGSQDRTLELAFVPFTAPVAMPVLIAVGAAPLWAIALSATITIASMVVMVRLAATIYERAILRTGGRLKARQVLAFVSRPGGSVAFCPWLYPDDCAPCGPMA